MSGRCSHGAFPTMLRKIHASYCYSYMAIIPDVHMGVARIFQRGGGGGHTDSYRGYSSDCHLNIVSCLLTRRLTKRGLRAPQDPPWLRLCVHPEVHEFMRNGGFSVQLSNDNTFGRIPIDQTLEEVVAKIRKHLGIPRALV